MNILFLFISVCLGLILGSFFNVLIYRLPLRESIVLPGSRCPACKKPLSLVENIPLISFIMLKGKCSGCQAKISWVYPAVETISAIAAVVLWKLKLEAVLVVDNFDWYTAVTVLVQAVSLLFLIPVVVIDILHYIIPDTITLGGLCCAVIVCFLPGGLTILDCFVGMISGGGLLYLCGIISQLVLKKEGMGGGDVKLMAFFGALFGWENALMSIVLGAFLGTIAAIIMLAKRKLRADHKIPFGPFLAAGIWLSALLGDKLISWYINIILSGTHQ